MDRTPPARFLGQRVNHLQVALFNLFFVSSISFVMALCPTRAVRNTDTMQQKNGEKTHMVTSRECNSINASQATGELQRGE